MIEADSSDVDRTFRETFQRYGPTSSVIRLDEDGVREIFLGYIERNDMNAIASVRAGAELIGIFTGLRVYLLHYFNTLLSDPDALVEIGDSSKETIDKEHLGHSPKCEIRARAAESLAICAELFVHFHEMGHIKACHLHLLRDQFAADYYEELPLISVSEGEARVRRCLEVQADHIAAFTSLNWWRIQWNSNPIGTHAHPSLEPDLLWSIAVISLFLIFDRAETSNDRIRTHPTPCQRLILLTMYASSEQAAKLARIEPLAKSAHPLLVWRLLSEWWKRREYLSGSPQLKVKEAARELPELSLENEYMDLLADYQERRGYQFWSKEDRTRFDPFRDREDLKAIVESIQWRGGKG